MLMNLDKQKNNWCSINYEGEKKKGGGGMQSKQTNVY